MQPLLRAAFSGILLMATTVIFAQEAKTDGQRPLQEIRKLLSDVEDNFERGDAKGLAACWTPRGDFAGHSGERIEGRAEIEKSFAQFFSGGKGRTLKLQVLSVRVAGADLALVDALPEVKPPTAEDGGEAILSFVLVKREGRWWIESAREIARPAAVQPYQLKDLEWLAGDWADEPAAQNNVSVTSTCDWTANRAFLIRRFKVEVKGELQRGGTEVIGWDPRAKRIRSWVFDTHGGFGENAWVRDGNRWLVRYCGVQADGTEVSATNVLTMVDADTILLQSKDRMTGGQRQADAPEIKIHRQPAPKDAGKAGASPAVEPKAPSPSLQPVSPRKRQTQRD